MIAMKRYFYILFVGVLLSLTSCVQEDIYVDDIYTPSANSGLQFVAAVEDFDKHDVATRAEGGVSDAHVSEMTMIIFKGDGEMLPAMDAKQNPLPSNHINIRRSNPTFLIEATRYKGTGIIASMEAGVTAKYYNNLATNLGECRIYIVANAYHLIGERLEAGEIQTETQLLEALVATDPTLKMPKDNNENPIGLPMIGTHGDDTFNLSYNATGNNSVATISMKKLYSKVEFTIQVKSNQVVAGQTPKFTLEDIEIYNIPSQIRMSHVDGQYVDVICGGNLSESDIAKYYLYNSVNGKAKHLDLPSKNTAYHDTSVTTDEKIEFVFYMPEHMVTPNTITYPQGMPEHLYQYYKPKGVDAVRNGDGTTSPSKIAPYVRLIGSYTDHNAQINKVSYDIYLGQNNYNDFTVKRNQRLCNYITITGLTNHKDAYPDIEGNVSIDHRVTMTSKGYNLSMEREAILDAHFEVRPLDVELSPGGSMTVVIPAGYKDMIAFESDAAAREATGDAKNLYIDNSKERKGVRKYFTTNLVTELWNAGNTDTEGNLTLTLKHSGELDENDKPKTEIHRIWFYVDENQNVYDETGTGKLDSESGNYTVSTTLYRNAKVNFYYADGATPDLSAEPSSTINFQQWNLWRVWSADGKRYYDIEHEEEYLNNYVSDAQYGSTQDGMPYGLVDIQLSNLYPAACLTLSDSSWITNLIRDYGKYIGMNSVEDMAIASYDQIQTFYDFYLTRDVETFTDKQKAELEVRPYSGHKFNEEIAATLKKNYAAQQVAHTYSEGNTAQIEKLNLTQAPSSAFAYCYHKNKRDANGDVCTINSDGTLNSTNLKWFLPSIDQIEDIALGAYDEFDRVFQNEKYWSCQPSYLRYKLNIIFRVLGFNVGTLTADYYNDNTSRARATSVYTTDGTNYTPLYSGAPGYSGTQNGRATLENNGSWLRPDYGLKFDMEQEGGYVENEITESEYIEKAPRNLPRTESCRIRAVYRSGEK